VGVISQNESQYWRSYVPKLINYQYFFVVHAVVFLFTL